MMYSRECMNDIYPTSLGSILWFYLLQLSWNVKLSLCFTWRYMGECRYTYNTMLLCWWCRLIHCVESCVDCNESLVFVNWLILLDCHYLKKDYPPCSYFIASQMLIYLIFCSKFVQSERFSFSTMPKCLSDIMFCESKGTCSRENVPVCMLWCYRFLCVSWRTWQKTM